MTKTWILLLDSDMEALRRQGAEGLRTHPDPAALLALHACRIRESDPVARLVLDAAIEAIVQEVRRQPASWSVPALLESLQPLVGAHAPLHRVEAAHRVLALAQARLTDRMSPEPPLAPHPPEPPGLPTEIEGLIAVLRELDEERRREAFEAILARGEAAVAPLEAALERSASQLMDARIGLLLARLGQTRLLRALDMAHEQALTSEARELLEEALLQIAARLETNPNGAPLEDILWVFRRARTVNGGLARALARVLNALAVVAPTMRLREALPLLKATWLHPVPPEFNDARHAIDAATRSLMYLPVPAACPPEAAANLPRPAEAAHEDSESLPMPSEEAR